MGRALRRSATAEPSTRSRQGNDGCEAAPVIRRRAGFWAVLAEQQQRFYTLTIADEPTRVGLSAEDITAVVDALVGNVFRYTAPGTEFAITLTRTAHAAALIVEDAGPGIPDPDTAMARGYSSHSTGLGLDIARRAAAASGGSVDIDRGTLGGARVRVSFGLAPVADPPRPRRTGHRRVVRRGSRPPDDRAP